MLNSLVYRTLVPDAALHKRTEGDEYRGALFALRAKSNRFLLEKAITPGLQEPALVSSFDGSIDKILLCFPKWSTENPKLVQAYRSVIDSLRLGTKFVVVHHQSIKSTVENWFTAAGHKPADVTYAALADYVNLTDWAEDAYVALKDGKDGSSYLMEPWEFKRAGDALIADVVEEFTDVRASQAPLIFQGGNCLVGNDFWLLGKDYFADTLELLQGQRAPVHVPEGVNPQDFARGLFSQFIDNKRKLILVGTKKAIPLREYMGTKADGEFFLDVAGGGIGTFQPIFHIDMFISLVGVSAQNKFQVLVGSPRLADQLLKTKSPFALDEVYDGIANSLSDQGFEVHRNPLVHWPTQGKAFSFSQLKELVSQPGYDSLLSAVEELAAVGAMNGSAVTVRDWHHITWNNCLVENSAAKGKNVYLPTFGHEAYSALKPIDAEMKNLWESLGFNVRQLGDFNEFAKRQGVVHCIKKYLGRGA